MPQMVLDAGLVVDRNIWTSSTMGIFSAILWLWEVV